VGPGFLKYIESFDLQKLQEKTLRAKETGAMFISRSGWIKVQKGGKKAEDRKKLSVTGKKKGRKLCLFIHLQETKRSIFDIRLKNNTQVPRIVCTTSQLPVPIPTMDLPC